MNCQLTTSTHRFLSRHLLIILALIAINNLNAATVLNVSMDEMLANSEFVFEGKAIAIDIEKGANINLTKTVVEFAIIDVIKGSYAGNSIRLRFAGGTVDGVTLRISGLHYPNLGETGIFFVESLSEDLIHPFYGWSQGHFLVTKDGHVTTRGEIPVVDIIETKTSEQGDSITHGDGIARGVILRKSRNEGPGMTREQFKNKLRTLQE